MDVVYPYKRTDEDFELRYSFRSLANLPHDKVIVAGDRPLIASSAVTCIPVHPIENRYMSSTANIVAAAERAVETKQFLVMHDDIFLLEPWGYQHQYRSTIEAYLATGSAAGDYREHIERTCDILKSHGVVEPLWFGLHTPVVYDRETLIALVHDFAGERYLLRTLYYNLFPAPCTRADDVKMHVWRGEPNGSVLSISDGVARQAAFRQWIARRFPSRSKYEISGRCLILGYAHTVWDEAAQALDGGPFEAVIASPEAAEHWPGDVLYVAHDDFQADRVARSIGFAEIVWCGRSEIQAA